MNETPTTVPNAHPLLAVWQQHIYAEFVTKNVDDAMATMTEDTHVLLVPVGTGGRGYEAVRAFYGTMFIPRIPADLEAAPISQTLGADCLVEEAVYSFTHTIAMDWMLPGVAPTGKRIEVAVVAIVGFRDGKVAYEHLYWDQASVLVQLGLLDARTLPILDAASARKVLGYAKAAAGGA